MTDQDLSVLRAPPHSVEAEQSLLGGLLLDNQAFDRIADLVSAQDFYRDDHRRIYRHIVRLIESGKPADLVTVCESIEASEDKGRTGGPAYLGALAQSSPGARNARRYAELVREHARRRSLLREAHALGEKATMPGSDAARLAEQAAALFGDLAVEDSVGGLPVPYGQAAAEAIEWADADREPGLRTGLQSLDELLGDALVPGALFVVGGRPGQGKSALAMQIAETVASSRPAVVFSLEMTRRELGMRALRHHTARLGDRSAAYDYLAGLQAHVEETSNLSTAQIAVRLRRLARKAGAPALVVVDYLQLLRERAENRLQEVSQASRNLKALGKASGCVVLATAQLSRAPETRTDRRPVLSDLRESGQLEQDADVILLLHRDDEQNDRTPGWEGVTELLLRKNRNGRVGSAHARFLSATTRFIDLEGALPRRETVRAVGGFRTGRPVTDVKMRAAGEEVTS